MKSNFFYKTTYFVVVYWIYIAAINIALSIFLILNNLYKNAISSNPPSSMYDLYSNFNLDISTNISLTIISLSCGVIVLFFLSKRFFKRYPDTQKSEIFNISLVFLIFNIIFSLKNFILTDISLISLELSRILIASFFAYFFLNFQFRKHSNILFANVGEQNKQSINQTNDFNVTLFKKSKRSTIFWSIVWIVVTFWLIISFLNSSSTDKSGFGMVVIFFYTPITFIFLSHLIKYLFNKKQINKKLG